MDFIRVPFGYVLEFFYGFLNNYGLALILFSFVVKLILLPFSAKSKKSMMKMSRLQPQLKQLELACGDDKQKYQQEVMALYKSEACTAAACGRSCRCCSFCRCTPSSANRCTT